MKRLITFTACLVMAAGFLAVPAVAAPQEFGLQALDAKLSTSQAGAHPDLTFSFEVKQDPSTAANGFGLHDSYAATRDVRFDLPPGLIGDPNVLGPPQQCSVSELVTYGAKGGGCINGSQIGRSKIFAYGLNDAFTEPVYMMEPPGGDVVARVGFIAGLYPTFIDFKVRSEGDYGLVAEIKDASAEAHLIKAETTTWGVPADPSHNTERCTAAEAFLGCVNSESRPPGSKRLAFLTNPTRCGVPLSMSVSVSSWAEPERFDTRSASFPAVSGCNSLVFGPELLVHPTSHRPSSPTGLDVTVRLPAAKGSEVLESSQMRDLKVTLPQGLVINPDASDGLATCSPQQVGLGNREPSHCPDAAKMADTEFEVAALPRRMKGAVYLREPEPGNLFRIWVVADDLGAHIKLPGQLQINKATGQITSIVLDSPQVPLREARLLFKSGYRAPLATPPTCGTFLSSYEFAPWSGSPPTTGTTPMTIDEGCAGQGGFSPGLSAGTTEPAGGKTSPFVFTLTREDGEQNPASLALALPKGLTASFAGIPRCGGAAALSGQCPAGSKIGRVTAAVGYGPAPLWVPQPGKRGTAVYLGGPYKGAPLSVIAVVPAQAGPFDLGDQVVRSAVYVDPVTAQATVRSDLLPQIIEGIPIAYRTVQAELDRPGGFTLNPTDCSKKSISATIQSTQGAIATPSTAFQASNCARLGFKPKLTFRLRGGTRRGSHPSLRAVVKPRPGDANFSSASVALPHSEFLDQAHIGTVCTRVQFAADACPAASIYGHAVAKTPLFEETLSGPVYLRSSNHSLPDVVAALRGPDTLPIEVDLDGRVDSINGGIRNTFELVPDAPVSSFVLTLKGGAKGLLVNSTNLCSGVHRATAKLTAQNGRQSTLRPPLEVSCGK